MAIQQQAEFLPQKLVKDSNETQQSCPKCGGEMKQGFIMDNSYLFRFVSQWAPGAPQSSFWNGTKLPEGSLPIGTYRCSTCGYLESYARPEFALE